MPGGLQKAMDRTINHAKNDFCFQSNILIVSKSDETEHEKLGEKYTKIYKNRSNSKTQPT